MANKFSGTKSAIYLQPAGGGTALVALCGRQLTASRERELVEITTTTGDEVGHVTGIKRGVVNFNNLSLFLTDSDNGFSDVKVQEWWSNGTKLFGQILDDPAGTDFRVIEAFYCFIRSYQINRNNNEVANFDCELVITAAGSPGPLPDVCPLVTVTRYARRLVLTFTGTEGFTYTFEILPYMSDTITGAPWEAEFTGLTPDTTYTIAVSVYDYTTGDTVQCADIITSTLPVLSLTLWGGETVEEACSEANAATVYMEQEPGIGAIIYTDSNLTTPYVAYPYVKIEDVVYEISQVTGEIIDVVGQCDGPTVYAYQVFASTGLTPCGEDPIYVYSTSSQFGPGIALYTSARLNVAVSGYNSIAPAPGSVVAPPYSEGEIFAISGNIVGASYGAIC